MFIHLSNARRVTQLYSEDGIHIILATIVMSNNLLHQHPHPIFLLYFDEDIVAGLLATAVCDPVVKFLLQVLWPDKPQKRYQVCTMPYRKERHSSESSQAHQEREMNPQVLSKDCQPLSSSRMGSSMSSASVSSGPWDISCW